MLKKASKAKVNVAPGTRVAIVASRYNARYVNSMLRAAKAELAKAKVAVEEIEAEMNAIPLDNGYSRRVFK